MKKYKLPKKLFLGVVAILMSMGVDVHFSCGPVAIPPSGLLCELLSHPEKAVITDPRPEFSWVVNSHYQDDVQTAYHIIVASSFKKISAFQGDILDTGKVTSSQSIHVEYAGKPLAENTRYWWTVRTWNVNGIPSGYSKPQAFNTGEFDIERAWPGESRWVKIEDESGKEFWGFENRHPISYHEVEPVRFTIKDDGHYFIDFGRAAFATLKIKYSIAAQTDSGDGEKEIEIRLGEKASADSVDADPGGGIIYKKVNMTLHAGLRTDTLQLPRYKSQYPQSQTMPAHMPEIIPFRYCEIIGGALELKANDITMLALYYQFDDDAANFTSSDQSLNDVYELCKYSVKANTFNGDYAASQRERMLYEADAYIHQMSHYALDREYAIARYSHENLIYHATWPTEWIMHSVLMAWADYLYTGDKESLVKYYPELKAKTLIALEREDGLISSKSEKLTDEVLDSIHFSGNALRDIVDWPHGTPDGEEFRGARGSTPEGEIDGYVFTPINTVVNAFHYRALVLMGKIAQHLGKEKDASFFRTRAERVKDSINRVLFDKQRGVYVDGEGTDHVTLHANMFPLAFGIVPEGQKESVVNYIKSREMACGVYGANYLIEALYDAGEDQYALDLLTSDSDRSWLNMIRMGSTMTTEAWDMKYKANIGWSHAWSASPAHLIPRCLMGVQPLEPGFGRFRIKPQVGDLSHASLDLPVIRGTVYVDFQYEKGKSFLLNVEIPANTSADVFIPLLMGAEPDVIVDGSRREGRIEDRYIVFDHIGSGKHQFKRII